MRLKRTAYQDTILRVKEFLKVPRVSWTLDDLYEPACVSRARYEGRESGWIAGWNSGVLSLCESKRLQGRKELLTEIVLRMHANGQSVQCIADVVHEPHSVVLSLIDQYRS